MYYSEFLERINQLKFDFSVESTIHNITEQYSLAQRSLRKCSNGLQVQNALALLPYHKKSCWELKMWKQVRLKAMVYQKSFRPQILTSGCPVGKEAEIESRAKYGQQLIKKLSEALTEQYGRGFSVDTLENVRRFFLTYQDRISETLFRKFDVEKSETVFSLFEKESPFTLPWSHYLQLDGVLHVLSNG